mmetsp:Transcript_17072/g.30816  ORF Transcript_17072/g.30816 Transcript_17072/m.30816 type:complete len:92 (-) Transcript_17072:323-598(-)
MLTFRELALSNDAGPQKGLSLHKQCRTQGLATRAVPVTALLPHEQTFRARMLLWPTLCQHALYVLMMPFPRIGCRRSPLRVDSIDLSSSGQ